MKATGSKSWRLKYRMDGVERIFVIGNYLAVSLAEARKAKEKAKAELGAGVDPNEAKQEKKRIGRERKGNTFAKLAGQFLAKAAN